ncbi:hypothetical protein H2248_011174 [Termitomyces sp. 'cryptogamus']|nr:hypothetical protein H2248_011174 [Termitomyces sp. 'cryptogamus']
MTPEERRYIEVVGFNLESYIAPYAVASLLQGMVLILFVPTFCILTQMQGSRRRRLMILSLIAVGLLLSTGYTLTTIIDIVAALRSLSWGNQSPGEKNARMQQIVFHTSILQLWCIRFFPILNDTLIAWRNWVIFSQNRWTLYATGFFWATSTLTGIVHLALSSNPNTNFSNSQVNNPLFLLSMTLSVATMLQQPVQLHGHCGDAENSFHGNLFRIVQQICGRLCTFFWRLV